MLIPTTEVEILDTAYVTMPWGAIFNYGHFLLDCLPSVPILQAPKEAANYPFLLPELKPWQRRHFRLCNVENLLETSSDVVYLSNLFYTSCIDHFLHTPNVNISDLRNQQMTNYKNNTENNSKIYITRRHNDKRLFKNEESLLKCLRHMNFTVLDPSEYSVDDQISIFSHARIIIGCTGAAFANIIYCQPKTVIFEIQPSTLLGVWVRNICAILNLSWRPFFTNADGNLDPPIVGGVPRPEIGASFMVNVETIVAFIAEYS